MGRPRIPSFCNLEFNQTAPKMSCEYSDGGDRTAENESSSAGCSLSERLRPKIRKAPDLEGLAVFTWGRGEDGQLGLGDTSDQDEPTYVDALRGVGVRQIACGSGHTVVLSTEGEVFTWGKFISRRDCIFQHRML